MRPFDEPKYISDTYLPRRKRSVSEEIYVFLELVLINLYSWNSFNSLPFLFGSEYLTNHSLINFDLNILFIELNEDSYGYSSG